MLYLRLLGGALLETDESVVQGPASRRHPLALLALLATAPSQTLARGTIVGLLWPDSGEARARNRLNTCVHRVRSGLAREVLLSSGDALRLNVESLYCDVCRFERAIREGDPKEAVELYGGPFLEGFRLKGAPAFEKWVDRERARLMEAYDDALETLAEEAARRGDLSAAAGRWRRRAEGAPHDSRVTLRLMEALAAAGNLSGALRAAEAHSRFVREELEAEPARTVEDLAQRLRADSEAGAASAGRVASLPTDPRAIAVLPFQSLGGGEEAERFAAGVHSDLLTRLAAVPSLTVISRTSVLGYGDGHATIPEIARTLGVGTIVEGELQIAGDRMRLNVQLVDAASDVHRWAESYDRPLTAEDVFDLQRDVVDSIAASLEARLDVPGERAGEGPPTGDLEAYRLVTVGWARLDQRTEVGMREAADRFQRAIERDPSYALAWAGRAQALTLLYQYGYEEAEPALSEAEAAATRSVQLNPKLAAGHASLMLLHDTRHDGPATVRALRRAVELQPSYAEAYNWMSWEYALMGRTEEVLEHARRAVRLNPLSPEAVSNLALGHLVTGELEAAIVEARRVRELEQGFTIGLFYEGLALYELGRFEDVILTLDGLHEAWASNGAEATLAIAHAASGQETRAREWRARLAQRGDAFAVGLIHAALGKTELAFQAFERAEVQAYWPVLSVHHLYRAVWHPLREDSRFERLLRRVRRAWGLEADGSFPAEG